MKFVADESLDRAIVERLRLDGHAIEYVADMAPGIPDEEVLDLAVRTSAVLLTADKDFGELVYKMKRSTAGVVLIRLAGITPAEKAKLVSDSVAAHETEIADAFSVIDFSSIRIRPQP